MGMLISVTSTFTILSLGTKLKTINDKAFQKKLSHDSNLNIITITIGKQYQNQTIKYNYYDYSYLH